MIISKVLGSFVKNGLRQIKVLCFGKNDVREGYHLSSFGDDSNPVANMQAIYAKTSNLSDPVIIGYINKQNLADIGEKRIFSTDEDGNVVSFIHLKNTGIIAVNGEGDNLVRFTDTEDTFNKFRDDVNAELVKIATGIVAGGGTYTPQPIVVDYSKAKVDELTTKPST